MLGDRVHRHAGVVNQRTQLEYRELCILHARLHVPAARVQAGLQQVTKGGGEVAAALTRPVPQRVSTMNSVPRPVSPLIP